MLVFTHSEGYDSWEEVEAEIAKAKLDPKCEEIQVDNYLMGEEYLHTRNKRQPIDLGLGLPGQWSKRVKVVRGEIERAYSVETVSTEEYESKAKKNRKTAKPPAS